MIRTLILALALLTLLLPGCAIPAGMAVTAWSLVKKAATIVRVVEIVLPEKAEPEDEEVEDDGGDGA